jgi:hypothetical protein
MNNRIILKNILSFLSKWALQKHNIDLIVIVGWFGTEIVRETSYTIVSEKYNVRRITRNIWWDLSMPLAILGYADKQRSILGWIKLIFRAFAYLMFGPKNHHQLIVNVNTINSYLPNYWQKFLKINKLVIINDNKNDQVITELVKVLDKNNSTVIYNKDTVSQSTIDQLQNYQLKSYSHNGDANLVIKKVNNIYNVEYNNNNIELFTKHFPIFALQNIGASIMLAIEMGIDLEEINYYLIKVEYTGAVFDKIVKNFRLE